MSSSVINGDTFAIHQSREPLRNIFDYFETPFEIEAYGREKGLLVAFLARWGEIEKELGLEV